MQLSSSRQRSLAIWGLLALLGIGSVAGLRFLDASQEQLSAEANDGDPSSLPTGSDEQALSTSSKLNIDYRADHPTHEPPNPLPSDTDTGAAQEMTFELANGLSLEERRISMPEFYEHVVVQFEIVGVQDESGWAHVGLQPGDTIAAVNGIPLRRLSLQERLDLIEDPEVELFITMYSQDGSVTTTSVSLVEALENGFPEPPKLDPDP